jgi:hypothetical protein
MSALANSPKKCNDLTAPWKSGPGWRAKHLRQLLPAPASKDQRYARSASKSCHKGWLPAQSHTRANGNSPMIPTTAQCLRKQVQPHATEPRSDLRNTDCWHFAAQRPLKHCCTLPRSQVCACALFPSPLNMPCLRAISNTGPTDHSSHSRPVDGIAALVQHATA